MIRWAFWFCVPTCLLTPLTKASDPLPDRLALLRNFVPNDGPVEPLPFDQFRLKLSDLIGIGIPGPEPSELRRTILRQCDDLKVRRQRLSPEELLRLGECHYRLNDLEGAYSAWLEASVKDRRGYWPLSHLALLKLVMGDFTEARRYRLAARDNMPRDIPGLSPQQTEWFFQVDGLVDQLVRQRLNEWREGVNADQLKPDALFGVSWEGDEGRYQPGGIAESERSKLPADAVASVQLLLLWMPHDSRLYWLLGELYNALGQPQWALTILNECVDPRRFQPEMLRNHRQILKEHFERLEAADKEKVKQMETTKRQSFFVAVAVGGALVGVLLFWQTILTVRRWRHRRTRA